MQFFKRKAKSSSRVGFAVSSDQLAVVHMGERKGAPYLIAWERVALQSENDVGKALAKVVKTMEIEGKQCSYVLNRKDYNLHLVEAPEVEDSELRAAMRWKIKDLLDMKLDDAAIDVVQVRIIAAMTDISVKLDSVVVFLLQQIPARLGFNGQYFLHLLAVGKQGSLRLYGFIFLAH
jgi:hypothetical protein